MTRFLPKVFFENSHPHVLVAGGAGFIGSHICEELLNAGCRVLCLDNWATGIKQNILKIKDNPNFDFLEHDITKPLPKTIPLPKYIFHTAGIEAYLNGEDLSLETLLVNSEGTKNLLELARETKSRFLLISAADVFKARVSIKSLKDYYGKERIFEGFFSHSEAKRFSEALCAEYFNKKDVDCRVVRISEVFGPRMMLSSGNVLAGLFKEALFSAYLEVPSFSDQKIYPVYIKDFVREIIKIMFSPSQKGAITYVVGKPVTIKGFAQIIEKNYQREIKISDEFKTAEQSVLPEDVKFIESNLELGIKETLNYFEEYKQFIPREIKKISEKRESEHKNFFLKGLKKVKSIERFLIYRLKQDKNVFIYPILIFLVLFFILPLFEFFVGIYLVFLTRESLVRDKLNIAGFTAEASSLYLSSSHNFFMRLGLLPIASTAEKFELTSRILLKTSKIYSNLNEIFNKALGKDPYDLNYLSKNVYLDLNSLYIDLSFLQAEGGDYLYFKGPDELRRLREIVSASSVFSKDLPNLLGVNGRKRYMIIFQNNMEIRPTGGFIGSFALVTFEGGRLIDLQVQDVYQSDGQLVGHVDPPLPIKNILGEANWYLRDSNWDPDFTISAARASWFLDKEMGIRPDGVVGVDLEFAKKLIGVFGDVDVGDFGEVLNADNFYEKTQFLVEDNFFPGSHKKEDFLTALARSLSFKISDLKNSIKRLEIAKVILSSLEERHLQIYLPGTDSANKLSDLNWDGSIKTVECNTLNCQAFSIFAVEANLGVNKANFFTKRFSSLDLFYFKKEIEFKLQLTYENSSKEGERLGGDYKNYLRIYTPQESKLVSARILDSENHEVETINPDQILEKGMSVFGFLVDVPVQSTRKVEVVWKLAHNLNLDEDGEMVLFLRKQAGLSSEPLFLNFYFPKKLKIEVPKDSFLTQQGISTYNTTLTKDLKLEIIWQH